MSLQLKLNLMITCLLITLLGFSTFFIVENAREDVRAEVSSTAELALHLLDAEILHYSSDFGWLNHSDSSTIFRLKSLGNIRHLKIDFFDKNGVLRETNRKSDQKLELDRAPEWFAKIMGSSSLGIPNQRRNIVLNGRFVGELVVTPDPSYEIAEVWNDTVGLLGIVAVFFVIINVLVYFLVKYTFKPVDRIKHALTQMELGHLNSRLPEFKQIELQEIGQKFNVMAETLQKSTHNNHKLTQQIIRLQEDERKNLARDIHDEIGQYLTAINMDASAIINGRKLTTAKESAQAISAVTRQMMDVVHQILQRLRPRVLDELGLGLALNELVHHWSQRSRGITVIKNIDIKLSGVDEVVSITAYRIMQECLTNIAKHADARQTIVHVTQDSDHIYLSIEDDGIGFDTAIPSKGFGLAGMKERIQGLMGDMQVESSLNQGTKVSIKLFKRVINEKVI